MIRLAIFDMDGTIFPSHLDWPEIRKLLKIEHGKSILKEIYGKKDPESLQKNRLLEHFEKQNTLSTRPHIGLKHLLKFLKQKQIHIALITNNNKENTSFLLQKYRLQFDYVLTREKELWKPDKAPLLYVMGQMGISPEESISIGDSQYDIISSQNAGIKQVFILNNRKNIDKSRFEGIHHFFSFKELQSLLSGILNVDMST